MNGLQVTGAEAILELGIYRCCVQLSCKREEGRGHRSYRLTVSYLVSCWEIWLGYCLYSAHQLCSYQGALKFSERKGFRRPKYGEWYSQIVLTCGGKVFWFADIKHSTLSSQIYTQVIITTKYPPPCPPSVLQPFSVAWCSMFYCSNLWCGAAVWFYSSCCVSSQRLLYFGGGQSDLYTHLPKFI